MESSHIMAFIRGEKMKELTPGEKYDVTITSVKERTALPVLDYTSGPTLRFSKRFLESIGIDIESIHKLDTKVVEFEVLDSSQPFAPVRKFYGEVMPSMGHV